MSKWLGRLKERARTFARGEHLHSVTVHGEPEKVAECGKTLYKKLYGSK